MKGSEIVFLRITQSPVSVKEERLIWKSEALPSMILDLPSLKVFAIGGMVADVTVHHIDGAGGDAFRIVIVIIVEP